MELQSENEYSPPDKTQMVNQSSGADQVADAAADLGVPVGMQFNDRFVTDQPGAGGPDASVRPEQRREASRELERLTAGLDLQEPCCGHLENDHVVETEDYLDVDHAPAGCRVKGAR